MRREWENAVHRESISDLQRLLLGGGEIEARDHYGQTALMLAAIDGSGRVVAWLMEHGAATRSHGEVRSQRLDACGRLRTCRGSAETHSGGGQPQFARNRRLQFFGQDSSGSRLGSGRTGDDRDPPVCE
jgi:hypothetical protein